MFIIYIYIMLTAVVLVLGYLCKTNLRYRNHKVNSDQVYICCIFLCFTLLMGLRDASVGVDTLPYTKIYRMIVEANSLEKAIELAPLSAPVYIFMCRLIGVFSKNPQSMVFFSAVIINVGLFSYIKKVSCDVAMSTFCWVGLTLFYSSMNGNRQCMALVLILHVLVFFAEDLKSKKGWILLLVAIGLHSTCLIVLIAVFGIALANKIKENSIIFIVTMIGSIIISLLFSQIAPLVIKILPRYNIYIAGGSRYSIFQNNGGGRIVLLYFFLLFICILWIFANQQSSITLGDFHNKMLPAAIFGAIFGIFNSKNELINRMLWFYICIYISFIPSTLEKYKGRTKLLLKSSIIVLLLIYSIISLRENQNGVTPYSFFFK